MQRTGEYVNYPLHPEDYHIGSDYGREFDPYPDGRRARYSANTIQNNSLQVNMAGRTPRIPRNSIPTSMPTSPMPDVHRVDDGGDLSRGPIRSPVTPRTAVPSIVSPRPVMPGASRFREADQVEPSRWTSPTQVSYPTSQTSHPFRGETISAFEPHNSSTPAPEKQRAREENYASGPREEDFASGPRYGGGSGHGGSGHGGSGHGGSGHGAADNSHSRVEEQDRSAVPSREYFGDGADEDGDYDWSESEEEFEPMDIQAEQAAQEEPLEVEEVVEQPQKKGLAKRFVGGFVSSLVPKFMSRGRNPPPPSLPQPSVAPQPAIVHTSPSGLRYVPTRPPPAVQSPQSPEPSRPATPSPSNSAIPSYAQENSLQSSGSGPSSHGPRTPPQRMATRLEDLPNPHDSKFDTTPMMSNPESVDLRLTADYDAMTDPEYTNGGGESTFSSRVNNVGKFITDFVHLPWIGPTVATVYSPFDSRRARYRDVKQPGVSWYSKEIPERVDLLASSPQPRRRRTKPAEPRQNAEAGPSKPRRHHTTQPSPSKRPRDATGARPPRTPRTMPGGGVEMPSPGASSHSHGQASYTYPQYYAPPQPFYIYPGPSPNASPSAGQALATGPLPGTLPVAAAPQPMPVYLIAAPAMPMLPGSPVEAHRGHRHQSPQLVPQFPVPVVAPTAPPSPPHSRSPRTRDLRSSPETIPTIPTQAVSSGRGTSSSGGGLHPTAALHVSPRNSQPKTRSSPGIV